MEKTIFVSKDKPQCLSIISFGPLIKYLKERQLKKNDQLHNYHKSIEEISLAADLAGPLTDPDTIVNHSALIQRMTTIALTESDPGMDFYAVTAPLSNTIIYSSDRYLDFFTTCGQDPYGVPEKNIFKQTNLELTYQIILEKFYGLTVIHNNTFVSQFNSEISQVQKFLEFELIADFINITTTANLPEFNNSHLSNLFSQVNINELQEALPLRLFSLEGILLIKVRDVTKREATNRVKDILLSMPYFGDLKFFEKLQEQLKNLVELPGASISLTSVLRDNNYLTDSQCYTSQHLSLQPISFAERDSLLWMHLKELFEEQSSLIISNFSESLLHQFPFLQSYAHAGVKGLMIFPLKFGRELMGVFSIVTNNPGSITQHHLHKVEPLIPLIVLALEKQSEKMDDEIDRVIKEQFTAVQSSVNWKFTQAARNYINQKNKGQDSKIESIVFENVFPLYGSIDVRNSSIERSTAIQKDLLAQLQLADGIIRKCKSEVYLFSLQEISYRIDKYISIASLVLFPGDELAIQSFLDDEICGLFNHLKIAIPAISNDIDDYFLLLNTNTNKISKQCTAFEESIAMINNELVKFLNVEQAKVQQIYAHYFEYFVTDGIDFNIYIGQSITPDKPYDQFYLKNLKLWQLTTLVKAAQKVSNLHDRIPVPLNTTQLILAHSKPLSISFRVAERKFDVDGAYNIHYEIIKKRIDKIKIMESGERLTQPGKIAIVFAHDKEAQEYISYIEYLQKEGLLEMDIQYFDLEELPGVRGLKALRVAIRMDNMVETGPSITGNYQLKAVS